LAEKNTISVTSENLINQFKNVFRFNKGDKVILFDGTGYDFLCAIDNIDKEQITLLKEDTIKNTVLPQKETYLFVSLVKKDNFEWIAQKATELGVSHIIPIVSDRSEKKDLNIERINKIIIEAAEQSGRGTLPVLCAVTDLASAIENYSYVKSIAWDPNATKFVSQDIDINLGVYIGPEGGWTTNELELFTQHGINIRSLGPQILRSETAVIAVISHLVF